VGAVDAEARHEGIASPSCCPASVIAAAAIDHPVTENPAVRLPTSDPSAYVLQTSSGEYVLYLMVENLHCAGCIRKIESALLSMEGVQSARVNMSSRRLRVSWSDSAVDGLEIMRCVAGLGYPVAPYDPAILRRHDQAEAKQLLAALAVAGFAAANVMLLSIAIWAGTYSDMDSTTRNLFHWISALIALPTIIYAGQPFFRSALKVLRVGRLNMDVPISLAVVMAAAMSLYQTSQGGEHVYFDASVMLLFFLLVGRYLDQSARSQARSTAEHLMALNGQAATVLTESGNQRSLPANQLKPGMFILVAAGERVGADGIVTAGRSLADCSVINGESLPVFVEPGTRIFAGTNNLDAPLTIRVDTEANDTLLAEIIRLVEVAEQGRAKYVRLAERAAAIYAPAVHILAGLTFGYWMLVGQQGMQAALTAAIAVLIITCPCALGLAVPAVQAVASGMLLRSGVLVKSADGLERLAACDIVVFDKTGTLTCGEPDLISHNLTDQQQIAIAVSLARHSRHPLSRALVRAFPNAERVILKNVVEVSGMGLSATSGQRLVHLGSAAHCGAAATDDNSLATTEDGFLELWFRHEGGSAGCLRFSDRIRPDARNTVRALRQLDLTIEIVSGDREVAVRSVARALGIAKWSSEYRPQDKVRRIEELKQAGHRVLMVGDGLNDAPALAAGFVSMSPASATDIAHVAADLIFRGKEIGPVVQAIRIARLANRLVKQNFALAAIYNVGAVPLAMAGAATPLLAAIAMSSSSILVTLNALRLRLVDKDLG